MTAQKGLAALGRITALILDERLMALRVAETARSATKARIAALDSTTGVEAVTVVAAERAQVLYQAWADRRRTELNQTLAQQTVVTMEREAEARAAFARNAVLAALAARVPPKR